MQKGLGDDDDEVDLDDLQRALDAIGALQLPDDLYMEHKMAPEEHKQMQRDAVEHDEAVDTSEADNGCSDQGGPSESESDAPPSPWIQSTARVPEPRAPSPLGQNQMVDTSSLLEELSSDDDEPVCGQADAVAVQTEDRL
eukprot:COSAG01_NODE_8208_length_2874_cov_3.616577_1_plen_140_part_00